MTDRSFPEISVLMPVYNGVPLLRSAIDSILSQTFRNFELIILNDGSTDSSQEVIDGYSDHRIVTRYHENIGLAGTLNRSLKLAKGRYICRLDQDDVAAPERLALQKEYLDSHSEVGVVGSAGLLATADGKIRAPASHALTDSQIRWFLLFDNPMIHSSIMFRRELLEACGGYKENPQYDCTEDYELWSRMARRTKFSNINAPLVTRTSLAEGISFANLPKQLMQAFQISVDNCRFFVGDSVPMTDIDIAILRSAWLSTSLPSEVTMTEVLRRLFAIKRATGALFNAVYEKRSLTERQSIKKLLALRYLDKMWTGPKQIIPVRLALVISLHPIQVLSFRFYLKLWVGFAHMVLARITKALGR